RRQRALDGVAGDVRADDLDGALKLKGLRAVRLRDAYLRIPLERPEVRARLVERREPAVDVLQREVRPGVVGPAGGPLKAPGDPDLLLLGHEGGYVLPLADAGQPELRHLDIRRGPRRGVRGDVQPVVAVGAGG